MTTWKAGIYESNNRRLAGTRVLREKDYQSAMFMQNLSSFTRFQIPNLEATAIGHSKPIISRFSSLNHVWFRCKC